MKESINANFTGGMAFSAEIDGFKIQVDAKKEFGGSDKGPRPKPLMLLALAGCTGMDVVSLLEKMRVPFEDLNIRVEGDIAEDHPKVFEKMHIIYEVKGKDLPLDKIEKAIEMSQEKYCGVAATYKKAMEITYEIKILS